MLDVLVHIRYKNIIMLASHKYTELKLRFERDDMLVNIRNTCAMNDVCCVLCMYKSIRYINKIITKWLVWLINTL